MQSLPCVLGQEGRNSSSSSPELWLPCILLSPRTCSITDSLPNLFLSIVSVPSIPLNLKVNSSVCCHYTKPNPAQCLSPATGPSFFPFLAEFLQELSTTSRPCSHSCVICISSSSFISLLTLFQEQSNGTGLLPGVSYYRQLLTSWNFLLSFLLLQLGLIPLLLFCEMSVVLQCPAVVSSSVVCYIPGGPGLSPCHHRQLAHMILSQLFNFLCLGFLLFQCE